MSTSDEGEGPDREPASYIRGGAGAPTTNRNVLVVSVAVGLVALLCLAAALAFDAAHKNARDRRLTNHGVPVTVTVTSCLGTASGTGITVIGFTCRGSFEVDGHRHIEVIRGSSDLLQRGDKVPAVVDPHAPTTLSTVNAARHAHASWRAYIVPVGLTISVLVAAAILLWWAPRRRPEMSSGGMSDEREVRAIQV